MKHVGVRPVGKLEVLDFKRKLYIEMLSDEKYRIWNLRQLRSGCGSVVKVIKELMGCIYCPTCDEYFAKEQWHVSER